MNRHSIFSLSAITRSRLAATAILGLGVIAGFVVGAATVSGLRAQAKPPAAYWVTETSAISDQAAYTKTLESGPGNSSSPYRKGIQSFGGHFLVLGGKIVPGGGSPPLRMAVIAFDSTEKAQQWFNDPTAVAFRAETAKEATSRNFIVEGVAN
jgi:uncharacterized protein (DUF1330 family)